MEEICLDLTYTQVMKIIYAFKRHPVLWDKCAPGYTNHTDRSNAWTLVATQTGISKAVCVKKMKHLLACLRRERNKLLKAKECGRVEAPQWRYWNDFKFWRGVADHEDDPLGTTPQKDILDPSDTPEWLKEAVCKRKSTSHPTLIVDGTNKRKTIVTANGNTAGAESCGEAVALGLKRMFPDQRIYADNLINQILYKGLIGDLDKNSHIVT